MSVNQLMDQKQLTDWILRRLGAPLVTVELTECHLTDAVDDAKHWFNAKKGVKRQAIMRVNASNSSYDLPDDVDTVLDVSFAVPPMDISIIFAPFMLIDDKVPYDVFAAPNTMGVYSSFVQTMQYVETAKRVIGADADWRQEGRKLFLFPVPKNDGSIWMDFKSNIITIEQLNERDHNLIKRYSLAKAKQDLSKIRGKFDSLPGAQAAVGLDARVLADEAKTELEVLDREIGQSGYPMHFITG